MTASRLFLSTVAAGLACGAAQAKPAALADTLIAMEKQSWVGWQGHDGAFYDRFLSADHVEVHADGPAGKAEVVAGVKAGCTVKSWSVDRFKVTRFSADMASLVYRAEQETTCGGGKVPSPVWVTSVYVRRDGHWQNAIYVHTPAR